MYLVNHVCNRFSLSLGGPFGVPALKLECSFTSLA